MMMCGYLVSFGFYWENPLFNCGSILDSRSVMVAKLEEEK
jgi:hypothetical protein